MKTTVASPDDIYRQIYKVVAFYQTCERLVALQLPVTKRFFHETIPQFTYGVS